MWTYFGKVYYWTKFQVNTISRLRSVKALKWYFTDWSVKYTYSHVTKKFQLEIILFCQFGYSNQVSSKHVKGIASYSKIWGLITLVCKICKSGRWQKNCQLSKILVKSSLLTKFEIEILKGTKVRGFLILPFSWYFQNLLTSARHNDVIGDDEILSKDVNQKFVHTVKIS